VIRATLDVNVLVSGFAQSSGAPGELVQWWLRRQFLLVLSEHILMGVADVWERPYWRARYLPTEAQRALSLLRDRASLVVPAPTVHDVGEDEEDDLVIATAVAGNAAFLVTGDRYLRAIGQYRDVTMLSPREFCQLLETEQQQTV
jgi:putative PIN family toxin of toxin-antitoxin system